MKLKIIGTGSKGNSYILEFKDFSILLDAGISYKEVIKNIKNKLIAVLVSHEHGDHSKYIEEYLKRGFQIYTNESVAKKFNYGFITSLKHLNLVKIKDLSIYAIEVNHDVDCLSFLIKTKENSVLYVTDTKEFNYYLNDVDNLIIECNFNYSDLIENVISGELNMLVAKRILNNHLSIEEVKKIIKKYKQVYNIILVHTSEKNFNEKEAIKELRGLTNANIYFARKNEVYNLEIFK